MSGGQYSYGDTRLQIDVLAGLVQLRPSAWRVCRLWAFRRGRGPERRRYAAGSARLDDRRFRETDERMEPLTRFDRSTWIRPFGGTGIDVSAVCMGGSQLGSRPEIFGREVLEEAAVSLVRQVFDSPIRFLDTSNGYSDGRSESRIGRAVREHGGLPADFVISTKVDPKNGDYSGARVRASVQESGDRLGIGRLPIVFLHNPEFYEFERLTEPGGAVDTLVELRNAEEIGHIGVAGGDTREIFRYVDLGVFEAVLVHNRWTLVDRSAGPLFERANRDGLAVLNAAVFGGGLLTDTGGKGRYAYRPAPEAVVAAARRMAEVCTAWGTDLATAALRFSLRNPRIASTVAGFTTPTTLAHTLDALDADLEEAFWEEIESLAPPPEYWLDNNEPWHP
jgi:D-threo-aldose 1-dehydrogenase